MYFLRLFIKNEIKYIAAVLFFLICGIFCASNVFCDIISKNINTDFICEILVNNTYAIPCILFAALVFILGTSVGGVVIINILCIAKGFYTALYADMFFSLEEIGGISAVYFLFLISENSLFILLCEKMLSSSFYFLKKCAQPFSLQEKFSYILKKHKKIFVVLTFYIAACIAQSFVMKNI